jgi:plastocyanin
VRRASSIVFAILLLVGLCAPPALMAQDPATPVEQEHAPSNPAAADPQPDPTPPPADPASEEPPADPTVPGEQRPSPAGEPAPAAQPALVVAAGAGTVAVADFSFTPASITVNVGDTVTWTNSGPDEPHTATANDGSFDTGDIPVGSSASHTFDQAGTFAYVCSIHPDQMSGTVTVASAGGGGGGGEEDDTTGGGAPSGSEAAAVAAPDAAGTATSLPPTGLVALPLALIGLGLVALGLRVRRGAVQPRG